MIWKWCLMEVHCVNRNYSAFSGNSVIIKKEKENYFISTVILASLQCNLKNVLMFYSLVYNLIVYDALAGWYLIWYLDSIYLCVRITEKEIYTPRSVNITYHISKKQSNFLFYQLICCSQWFFFAFCILQSLGWYIV